MQLLLRLGLAAAALRMSWLQTSELELLISRVGTLIHLSSSGLLVLLGFYTVIADKHHPCGINLVPDSRPSQPDQPDGSDCRRRAERIFCLIRMMSWIWGVVGLARKDWVTLGFSSLGLALTQLHVPKFSQLCWLFRLSLICCTCWMILWPIASNMERWLVLAFCTAHAVVGWSLLRSKAEHIVEIGYLVGVAMKMVPTNHELVWAFALVLTIVLSLVALETDQHNIWTSLHFGSVHSEGSDSQSTTTFPATKSSVKDKHCSCTCECEGEHEC